MPERAGILISGFGGQGVVSLGRVLGAAAVGQDLHASMLISHGTETRGGYVRSQVVISDAAIDDPAVGAPDVFCAMSAPAYARFIGLVRPGAVVVHEAGRVRPQAGHPAEHVAVAAEDLARERFGRPVFANAVLLGVVVRRLRGLLDPRRVEDALAQRLAAQAAANRAAFALGLGLGA